MSEAQTIQVRVQVIDVQPSTLDLVLPAFLPVNDLVQRIARDAGLESFTEDGRRRSFWLRARGRVMEPEETLSDLQIVAYETLHLLPEPREGGVVEHRRRGSESRPPESLFRQGLALAWPLVWALLWGLVLTVEREWYATLIPGLTLGMLCVSMARRIVPFAGRDPRLLGAAIGISAILVPLALVPAIASGQGAGTVLGEASPGLVASILGSVIGWIAWWTPVEPLPIAAEAVQERGAEPGARAESAVACGLCGGGVEASVRTACPCGSGVQFHRGCFNARRAVAQDDGESCAFCGAPR